MSVLEEEYLKNNVILQKNVLYLRNFVLLAQIL